MGIFSNIKQSLRESAERRAAEQKALNERMMTYHRGYDVFPDEVCGYFVSMLLGRFIKGLFIRLLLLGLVIGGGVLGYMYEAFGLVFVLIVPVLILIPWILVDISRLARIAGGNYDAFGAMVTNTYVEAHHSTDSDGRDTTTYTYFVWLNGIKCEVSGREYGKIGVGVYCYFIRLKAKYIKNDLFFFFPTDPAEQDHRIGQHYPEDELRLYSAPPANALATLMFVLGILGGIGSGIALVATDDGKQSGLSIWAYAAMGCFGLAVIGFIARGISKSIRNRRIIEEKRRTRQML